MSGLGGLNKSANGVVIGLVQFQLPTVVTKADLAAQTAKIVTMVGRARRNLGTMDLVVFPEHALHGPYKQDLVAGRYRLPWEDEVKVTDGTGFGFARPTRRHGEAATAEAAE